MSWYVADAIDKAIVRTKKCLFEPFDFWKWMKLAIIVMLIGSSGGSDNIGNIFSSIDDTISNPAVYDGLDQGVASFDNFLSEHMLLFGGIFLLLILLIFFLFYVSNVMEFIFVRSLITNNIKFWEYSRRYLRKGLGLMVFRIVESIVILAIMMILFLPFVIYIFMSEETSSPVLTGTFIALTVLSMFAILLLVIVAWMIESFINLSIPVSVATNVGIFRTFLAVFRQFKKDWKQIVFYWFGRIVLVISVGVAVLIVSFILLIIVGLISLVIDLGIYYALSGTSIVWFVLGAIIFVQLMFLSLLAAFVTLPANVFLKYHMLTFVQQWYPEVELNMFDDQAIEAESFGSENVDVGSDEGEYLEEASGDEWQ